MVGGIEPITRIAPQVQTGASVSERIVSDTSVQGSRQTEKAVNDREEQKQSLPGLSDSKEQLEDVVAVSEFGDTVQVSEDGKEQQEQQAEGSVVQLNSSESDRSMASTQATGNFETEDAFVEKSEEDKAIIEEKDSERDSLTDSETGSLTAYPKARLEQMYLQGEISQYDYETELERRSKLEEDSEEREQTLSDAVHKADQDLRDAEQTQDSITQAFSDQSSTTIDPKQRLDAMEQLDALGEAQRQDKSNEQQLQVHLG